MLTAIIQMLLNVSIAIVGGSLIDAFGGGNDDDLLRILCRIIAQFIASFLFIMMINWGFTRFGLDAPSNGVFFTSVFLAVQHNMFTDIQKLSRTPSRS